MEKEGGMIDWGERWICQCAQKSGDFSPCNYRYHSKCDEDVGCVEYKCKEMEKEGGMIDWGERWNCQCARKFGDFSPCNYRYHSKCDEDVGCVEWTDKCKEMEKEGGMIDWGERWICQCAQKSGDFSPCHYLYHSKCDEDVGCVEYKCKEME